VESLRIVAMIVSRGFPRVASESSLRRSQSRFMQPARRPLVGSSLTVHAPHYRGADGGRSGPILRGVHHSLKRLGLRKFVLASSVAAMGAPVLAHHSAAMFDHMRTITVQGTVKEFQYTNPHSWLQVVVVSPDGKMTEWGFEAEGPSTLLHMGIKPRTFKPGSKVTVVANPMKDGRLAGSWITVTTADGTVYGMRRGAPPPPRTAPPQP
jgi:hypothetical protein